MIRRAVLNNPAVLDNFDWFNDYRDTFNWLTGLAIQKPRPSPTPYRRSIPNA